MNLSKESVKTLFLTLIFFSIVGTYWFLGIIRDTIFFKVCFPEIFGWPAGYGRYLQPYAKMASPFVILIFILIYSKLVDLTKKQNLFYILGVFFAICFAGIGSVLFANHFWHNVTSHQLALTGWFAYFISDAFGSLLMALFWSFAVSITNVNDAKSSFPTIVAGAQVGSILGSLGTALIKHFNTVWPLYFLGVGMIFGIMALVRLFTLKVKIDDHEETAKEKKAHEGAKGFINGITLLIKSPYLISIFAVSTLYDIVVSLVDYRMKCFLDTSSAFSGEVGFTIFQTIYGVSVNTLTLILAIIGTKRLLHTIGPSRTVFIYPIFAGISTIGMLIYLIFGTFDHHFILWYSLIVLAISKALTYGLNNPTRDILYIPTSEDTKFKTKAFTETFGNRASSMTGSTLNNLLKNNLHMLVIVGSVLSLGIIGLWLAAAMYVSKEFKKLNKKEEVA